MKKVIVELQGTKELENQVEVKRDLRNNRIETLLLKEKPKFKSLGMGLHREIFYYGTKIYDEDGKSFDAIVTSDNKIHVNWKNDNEIRNQFGLNYRWEFFDDILDRTWSNKSINEWLKGTRHRTLKEMFNRILKKNEHFIWYPDDRWHKFIVLDILSGYFLELFETKGRTLFKADKRSGKSKQCQVYQLLGFNPMMSADWTKSSMFRAVESTKGTPIIDNFDEIPDELRKDIMTVYRQYRKGIKSIRTEGERKKKPMGYDLFCSMILNNQLGLDSTSEDRSNIVKMLGTKGSITKRQLRLDDPEWDEIRDDCFICGLQNWKIVKEISDKLLSNVLSDRELETIFPHLVLAKIIDEKLYKEILKLKQEDIEQRKITELSEDWLYNAVELILKKLKEDNAMALWIKVKDIVNELSPIVFDSLAKDYNKNKRGLAIFLGKKFKANPLFKGRMVKGNAEYLFRKVDVIRFCELKEYDELVSTYSTYPTLSTNSTQSTQVEKVECVEREERGVTNDND